MEQQEYIFQEFPKWVKGVGADGVETDLVVQDASEEAEQAERLEVLKKAKDKAAKGAKKVAQSADGADGVETEGASA